METLRGWLSVTKGKTYLASEKGWFELICDDNTPWSSPVVEDRNSIRISGERRDLIKFVVVSIDSMGAPVKRRPVFAINGPDIVLKASKARLAVSRFLDQRDIPEVMLPAIWTLSREYGQEEIAITHPNLKRPLFLMQSPEFPMYTALALGIGAFHCWGRCFRYEELSPCHLMEFEQVDIGFSHGTLGEIMSLVEDIVRVVGDALGVEVTPKKYEIRASSGFNKTAIRDADERIIVFKEFVPSEAADVIVNRMRSVGAFAQILSTEPLILAVRASDSDVHNEVNRVLDSVTRIMSSQTASNTIRPWWLSEIPVRWEDPVSARISEYHIRSITSGRRTSEEGTEFTDEAELYINDVEVAHAGRFADSNEFLRNIEEGDVDSTRFSWIHPLLESAPVGMVKVGIGWERLVASLLEVDPMEVQLFPRRGNGAPVTFKAR